MQSIHSGNRIIVNKDIARKEGPYATKGETGTVVEIFHSFNGKWKKPKQNAKCLMDGEGSVIKTFRLSSINLVNQGS